MKKSFILAVFSITTFAVTSEVFAASKMEQRLLKLQQDRQQYHQNALANADAIRKEDELDADELALFKARELAIDGAFAAIDNADKQIAGLIVLARQNRQDLVNQETAYNAALSAVTNLAAQISALRIKAASSDTYRKSLQQAEDQLRRYEESVNELGLTIAEAAR